MPIDNVMPRDIIATTIERYGSKLEENMPRMSPLFKWIMKNGRSSEGGYQAGGGFSGRFYRQPLEYGLNTNAMWYYGKEPLRADETEFAAYADYYVRQFGGTITITGLDEIINDGKEAVLNLMASKLTNLEKSLQYMLAESAYFDGTEHDGKAFGGVRLAVPDDPTMGKVGGLDRAVEVDQRGRKWWQSKALNVNSLTAPTAQQGQVRRMTRAYNRIGIEVNDGPHKIDMGLADKVHYLDYLEELQEKTMFTDTKRAGAGFQNIMHMGMDAPIMNDAVMPVTDHTYFLNSEHIHLRKAKRWMKSLPKARNPQQDVSLDTIVGAGNIAYSNLARQGVVFAA